MNQIQIMGILNVTADSFFEESRLHSDKLLLQKAEKYLHEGAAILDLGGFSTRPGAVEVTEDEELMRVSRAVELLRKEFGEAQLSVDTFRGKVAQCAIDLGANIINDISGFQFDANLLPVLGNAKFPYVLMHVEGDFHSMHQLQADRNPQLIVDRVRTYFQEKLAVLKQNGVENVILDPGFGFSKTMAENHILLQRMDELLDFNLPILAGISRKSMIYKKLGITPEESLNGTTVLNTVAALKGASILRVHDVKACKQMIDLLAI